jgi:hypothetical protein
MASAEAILDLAARCKSCGGKSFGNRISRPRKYFPGIKNCSATTAVFLIRQPDLDEP